MFNAKDLFFFVIVALILVWISIDNLDLDSIQSLAYISFAASTMSNSNFFKKDRRKLGNFDYLPPIPYAISVAVFLVRPVLELRDHDYIISKVAQHNLYMTLVVVLVLFFDTYFDCKIPKNRKKLRCVLIPIAILFILAVVVLQCYYTKISM